MIDKIIKELIEEYTLDQAQQQYLEAFANCLSINATEEDLTHILRSSVEVFLHEQ